MWIPKSEEEIVNVVTSGSLEETAIFDAKKEIPAKNIETAKDIAAMANDGGVIIYGIAEDEYNRPTILNPIPLVNQAERIASIVRTSVAEPPDVKIYPIETKDDPSVGYLVIVIPASPRAPHMVEAGKQFRYYGRTAKGNTPLTEAEVARLYERRQRWEVNREALLDNEIQNAPLPSHQDFAYLYLFVRPVARKEAMLDEAVHEGERIHGVLHDLVDTVTNFTVFPRNYDPDLRHPKRWLKRVDGYFGRMDGANDPSQKRAPRDTLDLAIDFDGTGHIFCGRAAERIGNNFMFFPSLAAGITMRFITLLGILYDRANYMGPIDIGLAITGLKGCVITGNKGVIRGAIPYDRDKYRRTDRVSAIIFKEDPRSVAKKLLMPLFDAMSQELFDPFSE